MTMLLLLTLAGSGSVQDMMEAKEQEAKKPADPSADLGNYKLSPDAPVITPDTEDDGTDRLIIVNRPDVVRVVKRLKACGVENEKLRDAGQKLQNEKSNELPLWAAVLIGIGAGVAGAAVGVGIGLGIANRKP